MTEAASSFKRKPSYEASLNALGENPVLERVPTIKAVMPSQERRSAKDKSSQIEIFSRFALKVILRTNQRAAAKVFQAVVHNEVVMPYYLAVANSVLKKQKVKPDE
jgi:hypothetical protein